MTYFDSEAGNYDRWYDSDFGRLVDDVETETVFRLLKPSAGEKIIDIGCGTGNFSIKTAGMGCFVTGIDISDKMLETARKKAGELGLDIDFIKGDSGKLPFRDNMFDSAVSVTAFEFMKDPGRSFSEIMRVVKQGGKIVIGTINKNSPWGDYYESQVSVKKTVFRYASFLCRSDLEQMYSSGPAEIRECLFFPPDAEKEEIGPDLEDKYKNINSGGLLCGLWIK